MYPILSGPNDTYPLEVSREDGRIAHFTAAEARVQQPTAKGLANVIRLPKDLKWDVLVTDTRVVVYCTKYDKGGGWSGFGGGAVFALAANAVSKARAAHRRKGKVLVAHVRYPWLRSVGGSPKVGWLGAEHLRIQVDAKAGGEDHRYLFLTLLLPKQLDAVSIAHEINIRCAHYRLATDLSMDDSERESFQALATAPKKAPVASRPGEPNWSWYVMPTSFRVNSLTARPSPGERRWDSNAGGVNSAETGA